MVSALILALGLTFFPGQPHWYELNTAGVEWTVTQIQLEGGEANEDFDSRVSSDARIDR